MEKVKKIILKIPLVKILARWRAARKVWRFYRPLINKLPTPPSPPKKILFYPDRAVVNNPIFLMMYVLGYKAVFDINDDYAIAMRWEDSTFKLLNPELVQIAKHKKVVNLHCTDISKQRVDEAFRQVFGYGTEIDPLTFEGIALRKGNMNYKKDGQQIQCPIDSKEEGYIYQIVINNQFDEKYVMDYRVPVFNGVIPVVYQKLIAIEQRFTDITEKAYVKEPQEVFSMEEMDKIAALCKLMKVEYAELDILRNKDDGKIYIVDVNDTPGALPGNKRLLEGIDVFEQGGRQKAVEKLAITFYQQFMK